MRPTTTPARAGRCSSAAGSRKWIVRTPLDAREPRRTTLRISVPDVSLCATGSTAPSYAERRARPLPRRLARMERPARVRIRKRKPCVLARRRLLGWKVRFTSGDSTTSLLADAFGQRLVDWVGTLSALATPYRTIATTPGSNWNPEPPVDR